MLPVVLQSAVLIVCGVIWRITRPLGIDPVIVRQVLTNLVFILLLPALVLMVMWRAPLGLDTLRIAVLALFGLGIALGLILLWLRFRPTASPVMGAMVLAATFPNATYLGLPVLEKTFGPWARSVAIQYDLFACTPFLLTAGIALARRYGTHDGAPFSRFELFKVPALWAAVVGAFFNSMKVPFPTWLSELLTMMAAGVIPLMLISIGLSLQWPARARDRLAEITPVLVIKLLFTPLLVLGGAVAMGVAAPLSHAIVIEAAMPSMVIGLVICDRYNLDTTLYAQLVTASTLVALASLPLWHLALTS